jgi:hypothetical protein
VAAGGVSAVVAGRWLAMKIQMMIMIATTAAAAQSH